MSPLSCNGSKILWIIAADGVMVGAMSTLDLAVIGNCAFSALINRDARVVWSCLPRFDGDPVFCSLLDGGNPERAYGFYDIELEDFARSTQTYLHNTAIVVTKLYDKHGSAVEITDFAPRFKQMSRVYRPVMIVRRIRPLIGNPRIRIRLRPAIDYGAARPEITYGSNHIRYVIPAAAMRLTTDVPYPSCWRKFLSSWRSRAP